MFTISLFPSHWAACSDRVADFAQNYSTLSHAVVLVLSNHLVAFGAFQCSQMGPHFEMLGPHSIVRKCLFVPGGTNNNVLRAPCSCSYSCRIFLTIFENVALGVMIKVMDDMI